MTKKPTAENLKASGFTNPEAELARRENGVTPEVRPVQLSGSNAVPTIHEKMLRVMEDVKHIAKTGTNQFHGYKYVEESAVVEAVRQSMIAHKITMIPSVFGVEHREKLNSKGNLEYIVRVGMSFTFVDAEYPHWEGDTLGSGGHIVTRMYGEGQDPGDKGIYKAITGATKYALLTTFMIPKGEDPEADSGADERNEEVAPVLSKEQVTELVTLTQARGFENKRVFAFAAQLCGKPIGAYQDIPSKFFDQIKQAVSEAQS